MFFHYYMIASFMSGKRVFLCAMWPFSTQVWQGFSCDWYMIAKKRYVYTGLQSTKIVNVIFSGKIDFFFAFRIQIESLRLRMSLSNSSMSFTSPRFSISYGFMNLLRIDWGDSDSILTSNENKIHTTKKMVYLKGADIS